MPLETLSACWRGRRLTIALLVSFMTMTKSMPFLAQTKESAVKERKQNKPSMENNYSGVLS